MQCYAIARHFLPPDFSPIEKTDKQQISPKTKKGIMFGEEGKLTNEELEFISENTEIDIIPKITLGAIHFITVCCLQQVSLVISSFYPAMAV